MDKNVGKLEGGESLGHFHERKTFRLIGLNTASKSHGFNRIYATVQYGKEDWFHSKFDEGRYSNERLNALFDLFINSEESLWSGRTHKVIVRFDGYSSSGKPINPVITEVWLDNI